MTAFKIIAMPTEEARAYQSGHPDANGLAPEKHIAEGQGNPCRHCLQTIEEGAEMLVLSYRPFSSTQPYAEQGPIFLHSRACDRYSTDEALPVMFKRWDTVIVRGYGTDDRIRYQAAEVVPLDNLEAKCKELLGDEETAYLHVRTSRFNCYQCRVERTG